VCAQQIYYSLPAREAEQELIPIAVDADVPVVVWSPLAGGLLSGKYRRGQPEPAGTRRAADWKDPPVRDVNQLYDIIDVLVDIADQRRVSAAQVALAWLLGRPAVISLIIGARTLEQLADNLQAAELRLSEEERRRLDEVSLTPLAYPYWHQAATAADRLSAADLALLAPHLKK
jgi:aryl-alcohol dehydrogenase-like predicted oxidoreductase